MKTKLVNENFSANWVDNLLKSRGVNEEDINSLKFPTSELLNKPELLDNIDAAANKIIEYVNNNKHIGILLDSDVDGITSGTIMYKYLKEINPNVEITYFFHSGKQHGLEDNWENFIKANVNLVIEPDAGINDKNYHDLLGEAGIETVVLDHHEYENVGMSKYAIYVDNQTSPNYLNKNLAGCGVTWQCCRMMDKILNTTFAFKYIDLVALGCTADVMSPLSLENRYIFDYGFSHIQDPAFNALCQKQSYSMGGVVNYTSVAFYIAPLINACMRTGTSEEKLMMYKMFLHPDREVPSGKRGSQGEVVPITEECSRILTNVKARQQRLIDKYIEVFEGRIAEYGLNDNNILLIHLQDSDKFESELNGLISMRLSAKYHKPCLVVRDGFEGLTKGSARNPNGSPISGLKSFYIDCPYVEWGFGHENAHGVAIHTDKLDEFVEWFNNQTAELSFNENCYEVNFEATPLTGYLKEMCFDIAENDYLWGGDNPQPIISLKNFHINTSQCQYMGAKKDTIKMHLNGVDCIIFRSATLVDNWSSNNRDIIINCIGRPSINNYMGRKTIQILIDDIDWKEDNLLEF